MGIYHQEGHLAKYKRAEGTGRVQVYLKTNY
jgi:hypothetical protein